MFFCIFPRENSLSLSRLLRVCEYAAQVLKHSSTTQRVLLRDINERTNERTNDIMNFVKAQLEKAERFVENVEQKVAERVVPGLNNNNDSDDKIVIDVEEAYDSMFLPTKRRWNGNVFGFLYEEGKNYF